MVQLSLPHIMKDKKQKKNNTKKTRIIGLAVLTVAVVLGAFGLPYIFSGSSKQATIYVRKGTTLEQLKDSLAKHTDENFTSRVMTLLKVSCIDMSKRHGAFIIDKGESPLRAARHLRSGAPSGIKFTFHNVRTKEEWVQRAGKLYMVGADAFKQALNDPKLCAKYGKTTDNIVNILIPDSYEFYWDITPEDMLDKMKELHDKFWNTGQRQAKAKALGLTPDQIEIIASITEEETVQSDERGKVGRLYINRFKGGMRLQADPTVKYAIGDFSIKRLTNAMLQTQSPYNTYRVNGLPPGPIRLPEKSTINAILNSKPHNYIYMCAKSDFSGYHDFTTDYQTHLANAHKYQEALNKLNIK